MIVMATTVLDYAAAQIRETVGVMGAGLGAGTLLDIADGAARETLS